MKLFNRIPEYLEGIMDYYPDVFLFELNQTQYTHLWHQLSSSRYLWTKGSEIRPTNWFMYAFQSIKGWLGFDNHCDPEKISYNLNKLAYYGYMNKFVQPVFSSVRGYSMSPEICGLVVKEHSDLNTAQLQSELVKTYYIIEPLLNIEDYKRLKTNHRFGESWSRWWGIDLIPQLDPQDDSLILEVIKYWDTKGDSELVFLKKSKYAEKAAQYYYEKTLNPSLLLSLLPTRVLSICELPTWVDPSTRYLTRALAYDSELSIQYPQKFIEHHLKKKEYENAFNLLGLLKDSELVLNFLLKILNTGYKPVIKKDTPIAIILAKHYLKQKNYTSAQLLCSDIESLSPDAAFCIAVRDKKYIEAYELFKKLDSPESFSMPERKKLAEVFSNLAEDEYKSGKSNRDNKHWDEEKKHYLHSLVQKKKAHFLYPSEEYLEDLYTHKRGFSQLLIDIDIDLYKPEESRVADIQKAIKLLRECKSNNQEEQAYIKATLARGLMRLVDTLREKIAFSYYHRDPDFLTLDAQKEKYQTEISAFIKTLKELINLLEGSDDKEFRSKLGKAHFLLADVQLFFDINDSDINQHYKMAMQAVPNNPFYTLRVSELFHEEQEKFQNIGVPQLKDMGYSVMDYSHWFDERWVKKDQIIYNIKDIHQSPKKPTDEQSSSSVWERFEFQ